jgi:hypothetical protein
MHWFFNSINNYVFNAVKEPIKNSINNYVFICVTSKWRLRGSYRVIEDSRKATFEIEYWLGMSAMKLNCWMNM